MSVTLVFLSAVLIVLAIGYYYQKAALTAKTTTTTTKATTTTTTTTTTVAPPIVISPNYTNASWVNVPYLYTNPYAAQTGYSRTSSLQSDQAFALSQHYNLFTYNQDTSVTNTMYLYHQQPPAGFDTLIVYKNNRFWYTTNTTVEFGPNSNVAFSNVAFGTVLNTLQQASGNNLALVKGSVDPTTIASTTLVSGTYSVDAAMLNVVLNSGYSTMFYGGTTFPYAYTLTSFG